VLWVILGVIGIVLVIACANVANLLLVKAEGRARELSIRAALGAGTMRIARGLLIESVLLSSIGAVVGLGLAYLALRLLTSIGPSDLPRLSEIAIDPMVMSFTLTIAVCSGLLLGLVPLLRYAETSRTRVLAGGGRTASAGPERGRTRSTLAVVQVALALVLLISSVLMIRTFQATRRVEPGFTPAAEVRTTRIFIPEGQVREPERVARMQHDILESISRIPSVTSVAFATSVPMDGNSGGDVVFAEGVSYPPGKLPPIRRFKFVSPGIFQTLGSRMLVGRDFTWTDVHERRAVAIVSENLARELWGDPLAAIGRRIRMTPTTPWRETIAVVGDVHHDGVHQTPPTTVYWPVLMDLFVGRPAQANRSVVFAIHSQRTDEASLLREIQRAVWAVNPNLPLSDVGTLAEIYRRSMAQTSFALVMLVIAGGMALALSLVGIYSVISYAVAQRTREIGIRVALGAQPQTVRRMFVRHGLLLAASGVACGVGAALALMRSMSSLLFEVSPVDVPTYGAASLGLVAAVVVATYLPARRATRVDPLVSLRCE
jgi:predicted permease